MDKSAAQLRRALAEALRELRYRRRPGWSQDALAKKSGIDLGGLERGERLPSIGVLWQLAKLFRMSPSRVVSAIDRRYRELRRRRPPP